MKWLDLGKLIFCALGHSIIFFCFLFLVADDSLGSQDPKLFNIPLFYQVSTNVYRINLWVYIPFALLLYTLWLALQFGILHFFRHFLLKQFFSKKFTLFYLLLCGAGYVNLLVWMTMGMEGNIFAFIFVLPLLTVSLALTFMELKIFFQRPT
jgi:hypothetical protein